MHAAPSCVGRVRRGPGAPTRAHGVRTARQIPLRQAALAGRAPATRPDPLVDDAVSRALRADEGENVDACVAVDKQQVRRYVDALERRFGVPMENAGSA